MRVLGISAFYHDSAAALVEDGRIRAAAQEERFSRKKHDARFPGNAVAFCLQSVGGLRNVDYVVFYDKPLLKFERLLETYLAFAPRGFRSFRLAIPLWLREKLFQKQLLARELGGFDAGFDADQRLLFAEHHQSHAASAFFASPFAEAAVLTLDGVGEWATTSEWIGENNALRKLREIHFPHSLGLLYSAFTCHLGFKVNSGEYKLMGLAPFGTPRYRNLIFDNLIDLKSDGSFRLNLDYFDYCTGLTMTNPRFDRLFGQRPREPDRELLTQKHMDLAASIQSVIEEALLRMTRNLQSRTGLDNLCMAGGVALNCVAKGRILREKIFKRLWIQPASGDAGGALGAALAAYHVFSGAARRVGGHGDLMEGSCLGPAFDQRQIEERLRAAGAVFSTHTEAELMKLTVDALTQGRAVGWFQGRMEFGPRALGARSILADPRVPEMQRTLNLRIKYRESFRPFAPAVLREDVADWFDLDVDSPYMLLVAEVLERRRIQVSAEHAARSGIERLNATRSEIPAVTHVDYSARVQTVDQRTMPRFHALLSAFKRRTGCPVLVNTSFNIRGEPIVATPEDAFRCFMGTEIEWLAIGNCLLGKEQQDVRLRADYRREIDPD